MRRLECKVKVGSRTSMALSALLTVIAIGGCWWDDEVYGYDYYDYYYPYTYYYPADVGYSAYYWSDDYLYSDWYYSGAPLDAQDNIPAGAGGVIRALARGESVCPGQVTITPKMAAPACQTTGGATSVRSGATMVFAGCQTPAGGKLDGTIDVQATKSASEQTCSDSTRITLSHTTKITNLTYTSPNGERVVIPDQTDTGTNSYTYGQVPTTVGFNSTGQIQVFAANGTMSAALTQNGTRTLTFTPATKSYSVSGVVNIQDARSEARASLMGNNISRSADCCHPVGGTLMVTRSGGPNPGEHNWTFGPTCGQAAMDGATVQMPACL
jgi:hypothetical protein